MLLDESDRGLSIAQATGTGTWAHELNLGELLFDDAGVGLAVVNHQDP